MKFKSRLGQRVKSFRHLDVLIGLNLLDQTVYVS